MRKKKSVTRAWIGALQTCSLNAVGITFAEKYLHTAIDLSPSD